VERLRVDQARALLAESRVRISDVAAAVGFRNVDTFRRAFERRLALSPSTYRAQFTLEDGTAPSEP
jgi:transcriptional regulator GlxA family with amidase domain